MTGRLLNPQKEESPGFSDFKPLREMLMGSLKVFEAEREQGSRRLQRDKPFAQLAADFTEGILRDRKNMPQTPTF